MSVRSLIASLRPDHASTRSILKAGGVFGGVKMLTILCSLIRNKLIAVWIGPFGVGLVILFNSVTDMISTATRLSMDQSATRDIAGAGSRRLAHTAGVVRRWSLWLGAGGCALMCALSPLLSLWSFDSTDKWWAFCLLGTVPLATSVAQGYQAVMQGTRNFAGMVRTGAITAVGGTLSAIPLIYFFRERSIPWIITVYALFLLAAAWLNRVKVARVAMTLKETVEAGRGFLRLGAFLTLGLALGQAFSYLFVLYLNACASTDALGIYQAGYTIVNTYVGLIFSGIWIEYFPRLSAAAHSARRTGVMVSHQIRVSVWILMPVIAVFICADELIVRLVYAESFLATVPFITIGITGTLLRAASWCIANVMVARGDGHVYVVSETLSGALMLALNIAFYGAWGFAGLGISYVVWFAGYTAIVYYIYRRRYGYTLRPGTWSLVAEGMVFVTMTMGAKMLAGWWGALIPALLIVPVALKKLRK